MNNPFRLVAPVGFLIVFFTAACGGQPSVTPTSSLAPSATPQAASTPLPEKTPTAIATATATPPGVATVAGGVQLLEPQDAPVPQVPTPADIINGGIIRDGPFIFYLYLFRDPMFSPSPDIPSLYSDLDGMAAYMSWVYQGADLETPAHFSWGTWPDLHVFATENALSNRQGGGGELGIHLPGGQLSPGQSKAGDRIQVGIKVQTSQGEYGAVLSFSLQEGPGGFVPGDVTVEALPSGSVSTP